MSDFYTWKQFVDLVMAMMPVDSQRLGAEDYNKAILRQGVIHVQTLVPHFKTNHESIYHPNDLVVDGKASRGAKPPQSVIRDVWLFQTNAEDRRKGRRYPVESIPWADRFTLINGTASVTNTARISIDPHGETFYIYPEVFDGWLISMFWDGCKLEFQDEEQVPFTEQSAYAVAEFMKAKIEREVKRDLSMHNSYMLSCQEHIAQIFLEAKEQRGVKG